MVEKSASIRTVERFERDFGKKGIDDLLKSIGEFLISLEEFNESPYVADSERENTLRNLEANYPVVALRGLRAANYFGAKKRTTEVDELHRTLNEIEGVYRIAKSNLEKYG